MAKIAKVRNFSLITFYSNLSYYRKERRKLKGTRGKEEESEGNGGREGKKRKAREMKEKGESEGKRWNNVYVGKMRNWVNCRKVREKSVEIWKWNVCGRVPSKKEKVGKSGIMTEPVLTGAQLWTLDGKGKACSVNAG